MKIVHVITGLNNGGAEAVLYRLCSFDKNHQHQVISLMDAGKYGPLLEEAGIPVTCLRMPRGRLKFEGLRLLSRVIRSQKPDVVQTWMYHADLIGGSIARILGVPRVFWGIHHTTLERDKSRRSTIGIAYVNAWLSRWVPTGVACCAERAREVHSELGYSAKKLRVVFNGYDTGIFSPNAISRAQLRQEWGIKDETPLLGMVSRFDPLKDHENLLRSLSLLKQSGTKFRLALAGSGLEATNSTLDSWIKKYDLHSETLLLGQRNDVPAVMSALDLHVLSSNGEAFPNVVAEAMSCGTPCVTTDVGDAALIVGETGWVAPPSDPNSLANAIKFALIAYANKKEWQIRREAARRRVAERFSIEKMVDSYHDLWNLRFEAT